MIRAVLFDIGGVLEVVDPPEVWLAPWCRRLGRSLADVERALSGADPEGLVETGGLTEQQYGAQFARALDLDAAQAQQFMADMWDWYCGRLDGDLMCFAASLRPRCRTAILSNSADGARREEERRYAFSKTFDPIVYSHEVGLAKPDPAVYRLTCELLGAAPDEVVLLDDVVDNVAGARRFGMHAVLHRSTPASIRDVGRVLDEP